MRDVVALAPEIEITSSEFSTEALFDAANAKRTAAEVILHASRDPYPILDAVHFPSPLVIFDDVPARACQFRCAWRGSRASVDAVVLRVRQGLL